VERWLDGKAGTVIKVLGIVLIIALFLFLILEKTELNITQHRIISKDKRGVFQPSNWISSEDELRKEQERIENLGYSVVSYEEREVPTTRYEISIAGETKPVFEKRMSMIVQYRAVMEDFAGEKICSDWLEDLSKIEKREEDYLEKGYYCLLREDREFKETEYVLLGTEVRMTDFSNFIKSHLGISVRIIVILVVLAVFKLRERILRSVQQVGIIRKLIDGLQKFKKITEDTFSLWEPLRAVIVIFIIISLISFLLGELLALYKWIGGMLPYLLGGIATIVIASFAISLVLYISERIKKGDMIEFESQIGKIEKLGPIFTKIETPKNETIHVPNIMLTTKSMKRLTRQETTGEKPYIAHFSTTLSYKIPFGIVYCLFFLAIRDTADDLENDFERKRIGRGCECIRGLKEDIEKKISELRKILVAPLNGSGTIPDRNSIGKRIIELETQLKEHREYKPYVLIRKLDNYTVNYEFCVFTDHPFHLLKINHYIMKNLKRRFDEFGIEIMSPLQVSRRDFIG
jgi:small-conductance mechanosensitive channel